MVRVHLEGLKRSMLGKIQEEELFNQSATVCRLQNKSSVQAESLKNNKVVFLKMMKSASIRNKEVLFVACKKEKSFYFQI